MTDQTRESYLRDMADKLNVALFNNRMPKNYRVTCGFTTRKKAVGQCFNPASSDDGTHELIIDMRLDDKKEISHTLAHEMIHAIVGTKCGHRGPFKMLATEIGLVGPMTASIGGPQFFEVVDPILDAMGDYPHAALSRGTTVGKQSTRLIKAFCPHCGYTARITRKWIDDVGPPHCPLHGEMAIKV